MQTFHDQLSGFRAQIEAFLRRNGIHYVEAEDTHDFLDKVWVFIHQTQKENEELRDNLERIKNITEEHEQQEETN